MWERKNKDQVEIDSIKEDLSKLYEATASQTARITSLSQDIKAASSVALLERIESLERRFSSLHTLLTEKSISTGKEKLNKEGRSFAGLYRRSS